MNYTNITSLINYDEFEQIKEFVLKKGDNKIYRNFDSNNPHYRFEDFDVFFGADIGQKNINNDPEISNFNQLTIKDDKSDTIQYYELIIVRKGDLKENKAWIITGMEEGQIYLVDSYNKGLIAMKNNLPNYLKQIKKEVDF